MNPNAKLTMTIHLHSDNDFYLKILMASQAFYKWRKWDSERIHTDSLWQCWPRTQLSCAYPQEHPPSSCYSNYTANSQINKQQCIPLMKGKTKKESFQVTFQQRAGTIVRRRNFLLPLRHHTWHCSGQRKQDISERKTLKSQGIKRSLLEGITEAQILRNTIFI